MTLNGVNEASVKLVVVGAHLRGMPLNGELQDLGASFVRACRTAPSYRLFELPGETPSKPGLIRVEAGIGTAIEVELWLLDHAAFGRFVAKIPSPLGIGTIQLDDGSAEKGFLVEPVALKNARDISEFGGWRAFKSSL
jgi:allophanate hydrolase